MKKHPAILFLLSIVILTAGLTACFSPWTGNKGSITINIGSDNQSEAAVRVLVDPGVELAMMEHKITLKGPGGTITRTIKGNGSVNLEIVAGTWTVDVRAIGKRPMEYDAGQGFPERMLRAIGMETVEVSGGASVTVPLKMTTATEAASWDQLVYAIGKADPSGKKEIIVLSGDMTANSRAHLSDLNTDTVINHITLIADRNITIKRSYYLIVNPVFEIFSGSTLVLGKPGMSGTITIDGGKEEGANPYFPMIYVPNGTLELYDGVTLTNNINRTTDASYMGGAVALIPNSGSTADFYMYGGIIRDNESTDGGGVYIYRAGASFIMSGGSIIGNTALNNGGGVFFNGTASAFSKNSEGGIIYGIDEGSNSNISGMKGNAAYLYHPVAANYYRDVTLEPGDALSTTDTSSGWIEE